MTDAKRAQNFCERHSKIWEIARDVQSPVIGWYFKEYVLGMLFYRFISEDLSTYINKVQQKAGHHNFNYAALNDDDAESVRDLILKEKGFFIRPSELFTNVCGRAANDANLHKILDTVFKNIETSAQDTRNKNRMKGLFDDFDFDGYRLGDTVAERKENLAGLMNAVSKMPFGNHDDTSSGIFEDVCEHLMTMYAAKVGSVGGDFFTPQEVCELLVRITVVGKTEVRSVYDFACGSGSLLLKFAKVLGKENVRNGFFGQEIDAATYNLCRINMFLHGLNYQQFDIAHGDTLTKPYHRKKEPFEAIVSNPPASAQWKGYTDRRLAKDKRFAPAGALAPTSMADFAFVMHALSWLADNGTAAIISYPGALYRDGVEQDIRKYLIDANHIDAVVQLPHYILFGDSHHYCILVLKKDKADNKVLFIDATNEFVPTSDRNKLGEVHIKKILDCYARRKTERYFSHLADHKEIARKNYNISVESYVEPEDPRKIVSIKKFNAEIKEIVVRQSAFRTLTDATVTSLEK